MTGLRVEPTESRDYGPCDCCGGASRTVWGFVHDAQKTVAAYFVQWTLGQVDRHGATFDLIVGRWGEGAQPADRSSVSLEFRRTPQGPAFRVADSAGRPAATSELVGRSLSRVEVIGTPLAKLAFEVVDAVWVQDPRIDELVR